MAIKEQAIKTGVRKRLSVNNKGKKTAAGDKERIFGGHYHCDYSPRYEEPYDIYQKARKHIQKVKQEEKIKKFKKGVDR